MDMFLFSKIMSRKWSLWDKLRIILWKSHAPFLRFLIFCVLNLEYIFWIVNHLVMKFGKLIDIVMSIVFRNYFTLSNYLLANLHVWPCKGSDPLFSFLAARMVDMSLRGTIAQIFFREHANWMFFYKKETMSCMSFPPIYCQIKLLQIIIIPQIMNFIRTVYQETCLVYVFCFSFQRGSYPSVA